MCRIRSCCSSWNTKETYDRTQNADENLSENSEKVVSSESRVTDLWEVCVADGNALSGSRLPVDHVADVRLHLNE